MILAVVAVAAIAAQITATALQFSQPTVDVAISQIGSIAFRVTILVACVWSAAVVYPSRGHRPYLILAAGYLCAILVFAIGLARIEIAYWALLSDCIVQLLLLSGLAYIGILFQLPDHGIASLESDGDSNSIAAVTSAFDNWSS
ncbi:hypothetical protein PMIN03_012549 [Paraphaeosphaeria minitans]